MSKVEASDDILDNDELKNALSKALWNTYEAQVNNIINNGFHMIIPPENSKTVWRLIFKPHRFKIITKNGKLIKRLRRKYSR